MFLLFKKRCLLTFIVDVIENPLREIVYCIVFGIVSKLVALCINLEFARYNPSTDWNLEARVGILRETG